MTYGWVRSTYAALRNLFNHNLNIVVAGSNRIGMCQFSRYKNEFINTPSQFEQPIEYIENILHAVVQKNVSMIIPSHDETELFAKNRSKFPSELVLPISSYDLLVKCNNKAFIQNYAQSIGISTPRLIEWDNVEQLQNSLKENSQKYVIRLRRSNSAKGVFYPNTHDDAVTQINALIKKYDLKPDRYPIVQEYVKGEGWGVSCLYWEGELIASFTHRRLLEKTESGGTSTLREHQPNPIIEEMAHKLLSSLNYHGLAMVEFKYCPESKQAWLIEVNPRLWGSIHLAISAGVEFPYLLYLAATEGPQAAKKYHSKAKIKYPWRSRWYLGDCILAVEKFQKGKISEACKLLLPGKTDTYDDINFRDPGAFIGEIAHYLNQLIIKRNLNPAEEGTLG